jgi:ribosome biogenesis protein BRX1
MLCSRGVQTRFREMITDIYNVVAHAKEEVKMERKMAKEHINQLCFERSCNNCLYFESRKHQDLYLWMMKSPEGPSIKFVVQNMSSCSELKLTGNCLKGSRPLLSFD